MIGRSKYAQFSDHELAVSLETYDDLWFLCRGKANDTEFASYVYERHRCREEIECRLEANASMDRASNEWWKAYDREKANE
jgi:hypothetical protein